MKTRIAILTLVVGLTLAVNFGQTAPKTGTNAAFESRVTIELQDGSRVIGQLDVPKLTFESDLLGNFKLPVESIRSVKWVGKTNSAILKAVNGDEMRVRLAATELQVATSFGEVKLPVSELRQMQVTTSGGPVDLKRGLIALWSAEGNARDSVEGNDGELQGGVGCTAGKVGQGFQFSGTPGRQIRIPARADLDAGAGDGLTLAVWVKPASLGLQPVVEWNDGYGKTGVHLWLSVGGASAGNGTGNLYANLMDRSGTAHQISSAANVVEPNTFQHLALTYDKASGVAVLYRNGEAIHTENLGVFVPETRFPFFFGARPGGSFSENENRFRGIIDETAVFDRALSPAEIQALTDQGNAGDRLLPPPGK